MKPDLSGIDRINQRFHNLTNVQTLGGTQGEPEPSPYSGLGASANTFSSPKSTLNPMKQADIMSASQRYK